MEILPWLDLQELLILCLIPVLACLLTHRSEGHVQVVIVNNVPLFFQGRDAPWCPTLRILHQYPEMMKRLRADQGAIKFVLSGANIMCPGLTSPGATIHDEVGSLHGNKILRDLLFQGIDLWACISMPMD